MIKLTAPRVITFVISLVLIALAVASLYIRIPYIGRSVITYRTWIFVAAYVVLALGVTSRSL